MRGGSGKEDGKYAVVRGKTSMGNLTSLTYGGRNVVYHIGIRSEPYLQ